jgi:glutamate 5-kinase
MTARAQLTKARRVVVKIGSALLADKDVDAFSRLAADVAVLRDRQMDVVLVSSGAIALGLEVLGFSERPKDLASLQACAAAGQSRLMARWDAAFSKHGTAVAQLLLTHDDLRDRRRYLNARHAFSRLLERGCVPVVNENDTVSVDEIKLGDNDTLAAQVCGLASADVVVLLTGAAGLFTADPAKDKRAERVVIVDDVEAVRAFAGDPAKHGTGGMRTKLDAALVARKHGASTLIAPGRLERVLARLFAGEDIGTWIRAGEGAKERARKRWIGTTLRPKGTLVVDEGAARALTKNASLLCAGVVGVKGAFEPGDLVAIEKKDGSALARGLVTLSAEDAKKVMGLRSDAARKKLDTPLPDELVHRDDLVLA